MWLFFAFLGPIAWAISAHMDKYLIEKYFKDGPVAVYMVFTAIVGILVLPFIFWFDKGVLNLPLKSIIIIMVSGALYMAAMIFYVQALQKEEASVVMPLFQISTLWLFLLAYVFLGETLTMLQIIGALLIVAGTAALSFNLSPTKSKKSKKIKTRFIFLMLACTFVLALSAVIFKFFAVKDEYWTTTFWTCAGEIVFGAALLTIPGYFRQFSRLLRENTKVVLGLNAANDLINLGADMSVRFAFVLAPLVLVEVISSTFTLFVFLFGIIITLFFPSLGKEDLSRKNLIQKGVSALVIAIGVIIINLK